MKKGEVLYNIESKNSTSERKDTTDEYRDYPVAVLTNGSSASASEVLAASFKDNMNSDIVGNTTYGKGTVQTTKELSNGTMIKYTIEKWLTPAGNNIDGEGIKPDYDIDLSEDYNNNPTKDNDAQLQKALELLK